MDGNSTNPFNCDDRLINGANYLKRAPLGDISVEMFVFLSNIFRYKDRE